MRSKSSLEGLDRIAKDMTHCDICRGRPSGGSGFLLKIQAHFAKFLRPFEQPAPLTKTLGKNVLLSRAFADFVHSDFDLESVGEYPVRGFSHPIELFSYQG